MAKGSNNGKPRKSHSYMPYDTSNSFVKRITTRVSEILPQPSSWISRWLAPTPQIDVMNETEEEDDEEEEEQTQPSAKRLCVGPSKGYEFPRQNHVNRISSLGPVTNEISPILNRRTEDDKATPGPSGLHLRAKPNFVFSTPATGNTSTGYISKANDDDVDGGESTSGCSSLIPQVEKSTPTFVKVVPQPRPHSVQKFTLPHNTGLKNSMPPKSKHLNLDFNLSNTRPTFDTFVFNNPQNNKSFSATNTSRNSLFDDSSSPFYKGRTMYGGASGCKEALSTSLLSPRLSMPKVVNVRPSTNTEQQRRDTIGTSAMRILKALEQFSSPVQESKNVTSKNEFLKRRRKIPKPYEELVIPQMPDLLRIKKREKPQQLPPSIISSPSTNSNPCRAASPPPPQVSEYSLRMDDGADQKFTGCIRGRINESLIEERVEEVNLPHVKLPITTLPIFNFTGLPKISNAPSLVKTTSSTHFTSTISSANSEAFKFSKPIIESDENSIVKSEAPSIRFSEPLDAHAFLNSSTEHKLDCSVPSKPSNTRPLPEKKAASDSLKMKSGSSGFSLKQKKSNKLEESESILVKPPAEFKSGSVMDFFNQDKGFGDKFKQPKGNWTCDGCWVSNSSEKVKCVACQTPRASEVKAASNVGKEWQCKKCFLSNKETDSKCKFCDVGKDSDASAISPTTSSSKNSSQCVGFNDCTVSQTTGASTSTQLPPILDSLFKKVQPSWGEIKTMVDDNKSDASSTSPSVAKPESTSKSKTPTFHFGSPQSTSEIKFGCFTNNETKQDQSNSVSSGFTFGIPKNETKGVIIEKEFKFGITPPKNNDFRQDSFKSNLKCDKVNKTESDDVTIIETVNANKQESTKVAPTSSHFSFGKAAVDKSKEPSTGESIEEAKPKKKVSFGEPLVEEKTISSEANSQSAVEFSFPTSTSGPTTFAYSSASPLFSNATSASNSDNHSSNLFKFGSNSSSISSSTETVTPVKTNTDSSVKTSSSFSFLQNSASSSTSLFSANEKKDTPSFANFPDNKPLVFSATSTSSASNKPLVTFSFGSSASNNNISSSDSSVGKDPSSSSIFGPKSDGKAFVLPNQTEEKKTSFFNSSTENKTNLYPSELNENKNIFSSKSEELRSKQSFNFSNTSTFAAPTTSGNMGFGSSVPAQSNSIESTTTNNQGFGFNAVGGIPSSYIFKSEESKPSFTFSANQSQTPTNSFNFQAEQTKFGTQQMQNNFTTPSSTPMFNPSPAVPAPFTFSAALPQSQPSQSVFGFSTPSQVPSGSTGNHFAFGSQNSLQNPTPAQPSQSQPPTFDPNVKPNFKFSSGTTPSFTATPSALPDNNIEERKIRKAVRRTRIVYKASNNFSD